MAGQVPDSLVLDHTPARGLEYIHLVQRFRLLIYDAPLVLLGLLPLPACDLLGRSIVGQVRDDGDSTILERRLCNGVEQQTISWLT